LIIKLITRVVLVAIAFAYITPYITGVQFHGNLWWALAASVIFNAAFWGLECLLGVIVFGVNIGTLGLGTFLTGSLKFFAALVTPSLALLGASQLLPKTLHVQNYFPGAVVYGLFLGGLLWASVPEQAKNKKA
jgi:hypothetical protein